MRWNQIEWIKKNEKSVNVSRSLLIHLFHSINNDVCVRKNGHTVDWNCNQVFERCHKNGNYETYHWDMCVCHINSSIFDGFFFLAMLYVIPIRLWILKKQNEYYDILIVTISGPKEIQLRKKSNKSFWNRLCTCLLPLILDRHLRWEISRVVYVLQLTKNVSAR